MRVTSIIRDSLIDYPGKNALVVFTRECNFNCPSCYAKKVFNGSPRINIFDYIGDWTDGVVLLGGEPTIQEDIVEFCGRLKKLGLSVKLDTNGSRPDVIKELISRGLVDYIALDLKGSLEKYNEVCRVMVDISQVKESVKLISSSRINYEFRTTIVPLVNSKGRMKWMSKDDVRKICEMIKDITKKDTHLYYIQKFISRNSEEMVDSRFGLDVISEEFVETPLGYLKEIQNYIKDILPGVRIRGE